MHLRVPCQLIPCGASHANVFLDRCKSFFICCCGDLSIEVSIIIRAKNSGLTNEGPGGIEPFFRAQFGGEQHKSRKDVHHSFGLSESILGCDEGSLVGGH